MKDFLQGTVTNEIPSNDEVIDEDQFFNDAELIGAETPEYVEMLAKPAAFLTGEVWGAKDRRNTQDGDWKQVELPWSRWIVGGAGTKALPAWGLSRHPVGKNKEGNCIVLGSSIGGSRKAKAMDSMFAMGLDIDSGARLDDVLDKIEKLGLFCLVYTSYNNGKRGLELKRDEVMRKLKIATDPTIIQVRQYLRDHDKARYEETFIAEVEIVEAKRQTKDGVVIALSTPPLEKFRLIFPLAEPVKLIDLAETQQAALDVWEDKITGLAQNTLGVNFDTSCTDPSRLFYTARHAKDAQDWYCAIVRGRPLAFDEVTPMKKATYLAMRGTSDPFALAGGADEGDKPPMALAPSGMSLNEWHSGAKDRFMLADLLDTECPDKIRVAGGEKQGTVHTECPFEHEHTTEGGTATMAVNAIDSESEYWTWFCKHDACQGRHKLQFLEKALADGWFEEDLLHSEDYLLPYDGDGIDPLLPEAEKQRLAAEAAEVRKAAAGDFLARAGEMTTDTAEAAVQGLIDDAHAAGIDKTERKKLDAAIIAATGYGKSDLNTLWKPHDDAAKRLAKVEAKALRSGGEWPDGAYPESDGFKNTCDYAARQLEAANAADPHTFHYMERLAAVRHDEKGGLKLKILEQADFAHWVNEECNFTVVRDDAPRNVCAPKEVVSHLFTADYSTYPALRGIMDTPFLAAPGRLVTQDGYDKRSRVYLKNSVAGMARVSEKPTDAEMQEAVDFIITEIFADFPFQGLDRETILERCRADGDGVPAVTSMFALLLLPFVRDVIDGPTPGHLLVKPAPGTGASLLHDVFSIIATGRVAPAMAMPPNKDEMSKTLTSVLANGQNIVFFDNLNHAVDAGELASAMTTPTYQARVLGKTQTVEVDVRCAWTFTGNNVHMSQELVRRLHVIPLDARVANPELRTGFRHEDIRGWATAHRTELVHACLTIIQRWVAEGMPLQSDTILASYENWSRVIGGILKTAGLKGFDTQQEALKKSTRDDKAEAEQQLMDRIADLGPADADTLKIGDVVEVDGVLMMGGKDSKFNIADMLNGYGYYAGQDAVLIDRWGYDRTNGEYVSTGVAGRKFRDYVKSVRAGTDAAGNLWQLEFEEGWDSHYRKPTYAVRKTLLKKVA